ncbi:hypothetical protein [Proteus genomosp. 4]|uniref:hypothetical protein n=1 Tax=Proteus genomosp. 4 TaxID=1311818 RepID=UPI0013A5B4F9|nr:hypothetical protein [Proteus genomosp. 4]
MNKKITRKLITIKDQKIINYLNKKKEVYGISNTDLINLALEEKYKNENKEDEEKSDYISIAIQLMRIRSVRDISPLKIKIPSKHIIGNDFEKIRSYKNKTDEYISKIKNNKYLHDLLKEELKKAIFLKEKEKEKEKEKVFSLIVFKKVIVNIHSADISGEDEINNEEILNFNITIHWSRFFIDFSIKGFLFFDFLKVKYLRYRDIFIPFNLYKKNLFNESFCFIHTQYGGYFCPVLKSPLDPCIIDECIKSKYKDNMLIELNSDNIVVSIEKLKRI